MRSSCTIADCGNPMKAHGYCGLHYMRWKRNGDPLGGRTTQGDPERFYQEVVLTCDRGVDDECLIWPFSRPGTGYATLRRGGKMRTVSRLLCREVYGEPPTPEHESAHSCGRGKQGCVTKGHLDWKTRKENVADTVTHGTSNRGERCGTSKLTEPQVRVILALKGKLRQKQIAELFPITPSHVSRIHSRDVWGWLNV